MKTWHGMAAGMVVLTAVVALRGQAPEVVLTRPGQIVVTAIMGEVTTVVAGERRAAKVDDRVRVDTVVATGRKSLATLTFSNGAVLELSPDSEIEIEELLQAAFGGNPKPEAMKEEPSVSRTRVRLARGDLRLAVKPLKVARGSAFVVATPAGNARVDEGAFYASVRMAQAGLGVCAVELQRGSAQFELAGAAGTPMPVGRRLAFAVEVDRRTGAVTVGEMPQAAAPKKK